MPRRKQPRSLRSSSLRALVKVILKSCKKSDGKEQDEIRRYVQDIPNTFANEYVDEIIRLCWDRNDSFDITSALHPKCTIISAKGESKPYCLPQKILRCLHVMSDLIRIEPQVDLWIPREKEWVGFQFPKLSNLRSITISLGTNPQLLTQVIENCPLLEDVEIVYSSYKDAPPSILRLLAKYKNLKKIVVDSMTPEVAVHLLDHLPNLEVLLITNIREVLPLCTCAYKLKDFIADLDANDAASVQNLVAHFPLLENLTMDRVDNEHVNLINELDHLKGLTLISGTSSNLLFLMDKCMFGLQRLQLENVTGLDSLFKQNMNASYPNLESLTIYWCTGINLAGIGEMFPNLKSLKLLDGEYLAHDLPCKMPHAEFQALEELEIVNVPVPQVRYLIPFCSRLKSLYVFNTSVSTCFHEILCNANLKELRTLTVHDNSMKREVIPIIFDSCGEVLEMVNLGSSELTFSLGCVHELSNQLKQYDMRFFIDDCFTYDPE